MSTEILCTGSVDDVSTLITDCQFTPEAFILLEKLPQKVIDRSEQQNLLYFAHFDYTIDFAHYTSGRIFQNDFELRWNRSDNKTQVVYLGVERSLPMLRVVREVDIEQCTPRPKSYYLFGKRLRAAQLAQIGSSASEGDFAELRIPRLLRYPPVPEKAQRVQLVIQEYIHKQTGELVLFRFQNLVPAKEDV